jgi:hypothetical protein
MKNAILVMSPPSSRTIHRIPTLERFKNQTVEEYVSKKFIYDEE